MEILALPVDGNQTSSVIVSKKCSGSNVVNLSSVCCTEGMRNV